MPTTHYTIKDNNINNTQKISRKNFLASLKKIILKLN